MVFYVLHPMEANLLPMIDGGINRLIFLLGVSKGKSSTSSWVDINYLLENSYLDRLSHFVLRLLCIRSERFSRFFIDAETRFFEERLEGIDMYTAYVAIVSLKEELECTIDTRQNQDVTEFYASMIETCSQMTKGILLRHVFDDTHGENCRKYMITVPFSFCPELWRKREVELRDGFCHIHCGAWKKLLRCFFNKLLRHFVKNISRFVNIRKMEIDPRFDAILRPLLDIFNQQWKIEGDLEIGSLLSSQVDEESELFPPCARNALMHLRANHRLRHQTRFRLTLFLKDIGMDVNEALTFWEDEYSKKYFGTSKGVETDLWSQRRSHYIYNIRHTYGMEGRFKKYSCYSCSYMQSSNESLEAACPFNKMSKMELVKFLHNSYPVRDSSSTGEIPPIEDILNYVSLGKPTEACKVCFTAQKKVLLSKKRTATLTCQENEKNSAAASSNSFPEDKITRKGLGLRNDSISQSSDCHTPMATEHNDTEMGLVEEASEPSAVTDEINKSPVNESKLQSDETDFVLSNPTQYYLALKKLQ